MRADLISAVADLHFDALPDDFLPSLGREFLQTVYYPAANRSTNGATLVALFENQVVGFVTIAHDSAAFTRDIVAGRLWRIALYALRAARHQTCHLWTSLAVFRAALLGRPDPVKAEIVFFAVAAAFRRRGIGRALVAAAMSHVERQGGRSCRTKTLARQTHVIRLYEREGWSVRDRFRFLGNEYVTIVGDVRSG